MKPKSRRNVARLSILLAACVIAGLVVVSILRHSSVDSAKPKGALPASRARPSDKSLIRGLRYSAVLGDEAQLFIEADQFRVGKKKIGFLRVSLLNEAEIRNARIRLVRSPSQAPAGTPGLSQGTQPQGAPEQTPESPMLLMDSARAILKEIESSKAFPGMSSSKIVSVKIAPIDFQIQEGNASLLKISAGRAGFDIKNRKVIFTEGVHLAAGKESWTGDELTVDSQSGRVIGRTRGGQGAQEKQEDLTSILQEVTELEAVKGQ